MSIVNSDSFSGLDFNSTYIYNYWNDVAKVPTLTHLNTKYETITIDPGHF